MDLSLLTVSLSGGVKAMSCASIKASRTASKCEEVPLSVARRSHRTLALVCKIIRPFASNSH